MNDNLENKNFNNQEESGISIKDLFGIAFKYKFMILAVTVVCTLIALIYVVAFATPIYKSNACAVVTIAKVTGSGENEQTSIDYTNTQKIVETIASLTTKDIVVNEVVNLLNPSEKASEEVKNASLVYLAKIDDKAKNDLGDEYKALDFSFVTSKYLKKNISVSSSSTQYLIDFSLESADQVAASYVLDCVLEQLIKVCDSENFSMLNKTVNQVNDASYATYSKPNKTTTVIIGFAIGIVISVAIVVLIELCRTHFKDVHEVEYTLKSTVIGQVYDVEMKKHTRRELAVKSLDVNKTNYNKLISTLDYYAENNDLKVIQVTSSIPSEGKSTVIFNTAREMTILEKKVLLIDLDINRPVQHRMVGLHRNPGFVEYAIGEAKLNDIIHHLEEGFDMICAGSKSVNSLILLNGQKLSKLLNECKELGYDYILIDCPPIHASADAVAISKNVDGVLFVVSEKESKKSLAIDAVKQLKDRNIPIIGCVFNNMEIKGKSSNYYYYYKYYSHEDDTKLDKLENIPEEVEEINEDKAKETMENLDKVNLDNSFLE